MRNKLVAKWIVFGYSMICIQCDFVSETSLLLHNDLGSSVKATLYKFDGVKDTTFVVGSKSDTYIDHIQRINSYDPAEFGWVIAHFDSIKIVNGVRKSIKDFKNKQEWTLEKKNKTNTEYELIIDESDF